MPCSVVFLGLADWLPARNSQTAPVVHRRANIAAADNCRARLRQRWDNLINQPSIGRKRDEVRIGYRSVAEGDYIICPRLYLKQSRIFCDCGDSAVFAQLNKSGMELDEVGGLTAARFRMLKKN